MPADEQPELRKKRAKIVSACSECRRKKTKCNGELPCRNCLKSQVSCVYPSPHNDDKRNTPSKVALEAIEDRLKAIEDMLKIILQSQMTLVDLDPVAVNNFLGRNKISSPISASSCRSPTPHQQPSPPLSHSAHTQELRLPSIHNLSPYPLPQPKHQLPRDLPPLTFQPHNYYGTLTEEHNYPEEEYTLQPIKKRKRE